MIDRTDAQVAIAIPNYIHFRSTLQGVHATHDNAAGRHDALVTREIEVGQRVLPINRFYTGIIDVQKFRSGTPYDDIADPVIINILSYDPFGTGELWYEARNSLITHPDIPYEDGIRHIYLYCKGRLNPEVLRKVGIEDGESLKDMLHYFCNSRTSEAVTPELRRMDDIVHRVKERKEVSIGYMITLFHDEDLRKEGRKEERADILGLFKMLKSQNRDADIDCMLDDPERIDALLEEYHSTVKS